MILGKMMGTINQLLVFTFKLVWSTSDYLRLLAYMGIDMHSQEIVFVYTAATS